MSMAQVEEVRVAEIKKGRQACKFVSFQRTLCQPGRTDWQWTAETVYPRLYEHERSLSKSTAQLHGKRARISAETLGLTLQRRKW